MKCTYATIDDENEIMIKWHVDDVLSRRPDLTKDQALEVLFNCKSQHDASVGINWEVIDIIAEGMYERPEDLDN